VSAKRVPIAVLAVAAMVGLTALLMGWPLERAVYLAPVIVVGFAALIGLGILWVKVILQHLRESRRPRLVIALWLAGIGLLVLLSVLGVELPREG
jgi:hypothetical protein